MTSGFCRRIQRFFGSVRQWPHVHASVRDFSTNPVYLAARRSVSALPEDFGSWNMISGKILRSCPLDFYTFST